MEDRRRQCDFAYACFLFSGVSWLATGIVTAIPFDEGTATLLGLMVLAPLILLSVMAMIVGLVLSVLVRRWPLVVLAAMSVLAVAEFVGEYGPVAFYNVVPIVYGLVVVAISGRWFLILRRRPTATLLTR